MADRKCTKQKNLTEDEGIFTKKVLVRMMKDNISWSKKKKMKEKKVWKVYDEGFMLEKL